MDADDDEDRGEHQHGSDNDFIDNLFRLVGVARGVTTLLAL